MTKLESLALEQELCRDLEEIKEIMECDADAEAKCRMISDILTAPPHYFKMPEPKIGHWISNAIQGEIDGQIVKAFTCSECGAISIFRIVSGNIVNGDLCPNCGARMESEG